MSTTVWKLEIKLEIKNPEFLWWTGFCGQLVKGKTGNVFNTNLEYSHFNPYFKVVGTCYLYLSYMKWVLTRSLRISLDIALSRMRLLSSCPLARRSRIILLTRSSICSSWSRERWMHPSQFWHPCSVTHTCRAGHCPGRSLTGVTPRPSQRPVCGSQCIPHWQPIIRDR